jgi:antitoxin VapB
MVENRGRQVDMSLNIKNEKTHRLARELARITGESMTSAVEQAIRERLERLRAHSKKGMAERLLEIGRDCAAHLKEPYKSIDIDELLYDEKGMPK